MKIKTSLLIVISLLVLSSLFTPISYAYQLKDTISGLQNVKRPDNKICYHSSGKIIYAILQPSYPSGKSTINVYVYSSLGNKLGELTITTATNYYILDISIGKLDNDEILIYGIERFSTTALYLIAYRINIIGYTSSSRYYVLIDSGTDIANYSVNLGSIYTYSVDNKLYVVGNASYMFSVTQYLKIFIGRFTPSTNVITIYKLASGDITTHPVYDFHNSTATYNQYIYVLTSTKSDNTAQFYVADMSALTVVFLCNYPAGENFIDTRRINLLNAGIYESGNIKYLYFTWEYSYTSVSVRNIRVCQSRSVYNNTITAGNLLASGRSEIIISPNLATSSESAWSIGISTIKENATIYYVNVVDNAYHISKSDLNIVDWLDYAEFDQWVPEYTAIADNELDVTWGAQITNLVIYTPTGNIEILENQGNTEIYLITPLYIEYDITLSYTPSDNPLLTDTSYRFTITTYANTLPTALKIIGYGDNTQFLSGITESNGQKQFTMTTAIGGIHTITIKLYDLNNVLRKTESFDYLFKKVSVGTDITQEDTLMIGINSMFGIIPALIILGLPALLFYQIKNDVIMVVVGLTIGSVIGVLGGVIPLYILFIVVLCDLLIMFYVRKGTGETGEG